MGGGSSTEALVGLAMGAIEAGMRNTVAIYRSMNGYSEFRIGGTGARAAQPVRGLDLAQVPFGMRSAGQNFAPTFLRHRSEEHTSELQSLTNLVCRLLLGKKKYVVGIYESLRCNSQFFSV